MRPIERSNRGTKLLDHEKRVQVLERRVPVDFPHWGSVLLEQVNNANNESDSFHFTFPDECTPDPVECEEEFVTDGDYLLFPTGHDGPFHVYMTVAAVGGFANFDDAYVATSAGANTPSKKFGLQVQQEVWRDNAPFGFITTWGFRSKGEVLGLDSDAGNADIREFWLHWIGTGSGIFQPDRDRRALKFVWTWNHAADISFLGNAAVALDPPDQQIGGLGGAF